MLHKKMDGGRSSVGRAPGCGPGGRGFKSRRSPQIIQLVRLTDLTFYFLFPTQAGNMGVKEVRLCLCD